MQRLEREGLSSYGYRMTIQGVDDDLVHLLNRRRPSRDERRWMAAALTRAAQKLSDEATQIGAERGFSKKRMGGSVEQNAAVVGQCEGLRNAASRLRAWAGRCLEGTTDDPNRRSAASLNAGASASPADARRPSR